MGYEYLVKPHAWATFVADRHSRGLMKRLGTAYVGGYVMCIIVIT